MPVWSRYGGAPGCCRSRPRPPVAAGTSSEEYLGQIVDAFGIGHDQVLAHQWVDNGPGWAVVRLATAREVLELQPDLSRIPAAMVGAIGAYPTEASTRSSCARSHLASASPRIPSAAA